MRPLSAELSGDAVGFAAALAPVAGFPGAGERTFAPGESIPGVTGDAERDASSSELAVFVVTRGSFDVHDADGAPTGATLQPGDFANAVAFTFSVQTHLTVKASNPVSARETETDDLDELLGEAPPPAHSRAYAIPWAAMPALRTSPELRPVFDQMTRCARLTRASAGPNALAPLAPSLSTSAPGSHGCPLDPLTLLTAAVKAVKADPNAGVEGRPARRAMLEGLGSEPAVVRLANAAVLARVPAGEVIARHGNVVGIEDGVLFAIAEGAATVVRRDFSSVSRLVAGDDFGDLVAVGDGAVGFPASLMAAEGGATVYCLPREAVDATCDQCELLRLTLRGKARETIRRLEGIRGGKTAAAGIEAISAAQRGSHVVLVADAVPRRDALVSAAEAAGSAAGCYAYGGSLEDALAVARRVIGRTAGGRAMTLMLVMPPPPPGLAAVRVVSGADTSEATLGGDAGAAAADPGQRAFWTSLGKLCAPWGGIALAHAPGLDAACAGAGEDVAALMIELVGVEVVPPYELGREMGSEPFEATQVTLTRDAAKAFRAAALESMEKGEEAMEKTNAASVPVNPEGASVEKAKTASERAVKSPVKSPVNSVAAAVKARPAPVSASQQKGGWGRPPPKKEKEKEKATKKKVAAAPAAPVTRTGLICRKLGIDPAVAAAQLSDVRPAVTVSAESLAPLPAAVSLTPEPETPALACLLLLESCQMSYRARQELRLVDLPSAVLACEAAKALGLRPGTADLGRFKRRGDALVEAVRRLAIKRGALAATPRDAEVTAVREKAAEDKRKRDADLLKKREEEIKAVALKLKEKKDRRLSSEAAAAAAAAAARERRLNAPKNAVAAMGTFLERYEADMRRRAAARRPSSAASRASSARLQPSTIPARPASAGRARVIGGAALTELTGADDALRRRENADRLYLRAVVKERLGGVYTGGKIPKDDAGLVEIVKAHAALLGITWPRARRRKRKDDAQDAGAAAAGAKQMTTREAKAAEARRSEKAARARRRACEKLRRVDFMRRYEIDMARRGAFATRASRSASAFGDVDGAYQRSVLRGDFSAAPSTGPPSPRSVGAGARWDDDEEDGRLSAQDSRGSWAGSAGGGFIRGQGRGKGGGGMLKRGEGVRRSRSRPTSAGRVRGDGDAATRERLEAARSALDELDDLAKEATTLTGTAGGAGAVAAWD